VPGFDRFECTLRPPFRLWLANAAVHVALAGLLLHALAAGLQPSLALVASLLMVVLHGVHEHGLLGRGVRRLRVQGDQVFLDGDAMPAWRLQRVHCATRHLMLAVLADDDGRTRPLRVAGDQLAEHETRRLLRWLRAGVPAVGPEAGAAARAVAGDARVSGGGPLRWASRARRNRQRG
jgi:hypothetical protein